MKKITVILFFYILISWVLTGCSHYQQHTAVSNTEPGVITLAAGRHLAPGEKDGYYCSKILGVWEPLITNDEQGNPRPALAIAWEMQDDGKKWIFYLRKNVLFHDGSKFNADAVIANFDRLKKGLKKSIFYALDINSYYPGLKEYSKIDDYTIQLVFAEPNINQLYNMMNFGSPIFNPNCFDAQGNFCGRDIGTGPFKIAENIANELLTLERNEYYYGQKAKLAKIKIRNIPSADVRYSALKAGEILGVLDLNAISPVLAEELKTEKNFFVSTNKSTMLRFLALNGTKFPFNDLRMRQALSLAIDRHALIESLYLNYAHPTANILNYTSPYYQEFAIEHDLQKAKALAKEVLQNQHYTVTYCIKGDDQLQKGEAELIAFWLGKIGLDVKIVPLEYSVLISRLKKGHYDIARLQQGLPNGDPYTIFKTFMLPQGGRNNGYCLGYKNEQVNLLMSKVKHTVDEEERKNIYAQLQMISVQEQPIVPLFNDINIVASSNKLKNFHAKYYGIELAEIELAGN